MTSKTDDQRRAEPVATRTEEHACDDQRRAEPVATRTEEHACDDQRRAEPVATLIASPVLAILSFLYAAVMRLRAWCYHVGVLPSESCGAFVVSVGNLQAGGTGKTPMVAFFARRWSEVQRLGIVSRGYGRVTRGSLRVNPDDISAAANYGDEPTWLAQKIGVPVQVGEKRPIAARDLIVSEALKLILLDDGFQHLALRRSFDIVLIDVSAPSWHWRVLPWGRMRESFRALRRADAVIFTKTETATESELLEFERRVIRWAGSRRAFEQKPEALPILRFSQRLEIDQMPAECVVFLAAGLARPDVFFKMVQAHPLRLRIAGRRSFPDHHVYTKEDVAELAQAAKAGGATHILVTEKDAVKLEKLWLPSELGLALVVSRLEVRPARESDEKQLERLDEIILRQVRGSARGSFGSGVRVSSGEPSA